MLQAQLFEFFKEKGITLDEIARKTGYSKLYLVNLHRGYDRLNARARFNFIIAYPETAVFLLPEQPAPAPGGGNGGESEA